MVRRSDLASAGVQLPPPRGDAKLGANELPSSPMPSRSAIAQMPPTLIAPMPPTLPTLLPRPGSGGMAKDKGHKASRFHPTSRGASHEFSAPSSFSRPTVEDLHLQQCENSSRQHSPAPPSPLPSRRPPVPNNSPESSPLPSPSGARRRPSTPQPSTRSRNPTPQPHAWVSADGVSHHGEQRPPAIPGLPGAASPARMPNLCRVGIGGTFVPTTAAVVSNGKFSWEARPWTKSGETSKVVLSAAQDANEEFRAYMEDGSKVADPLPVHGYHSSQTCGRVLDEQWRFFAVYDGHGGSQAMQLLEEHLHHRVAIELQTLRAPEKGFYDQDAVADALKQAFSKVDAELAMLGAWKYGSTATVALIHDSAAGKMLYVANVGDSRAVLVGDSAVKQLTVDHHATNPVEAARVERDGGCIFRKRVCGALSVTRALGDHEFKVQGGGVSGVPDVSACRVHGAKALVIASDGLWDSLEGADVQEILEDSICKAMEKETSPEYIGDCLCSTAAPALVQRAKDLGSRDNICTLVAFL